MEGLETDAMKESSASPGGKGGVEEERRCRFDLQTPEDTRQLVQGIVTRKVQGEYKRKKNRLLEHVLRHTGSIQQPEYIGDCVSVQHSNHAVLMVLRNPILRPTGTSVSYRMMFFAPWIHFIMIVTSSSSEARSSPLNGEDRIRRRHFHVRDGLIGVNDPVMPAAV